MAELTPLRFSPRLQAAVLVLGLVALLVAGLLGSGTISSSMDQLAATTGRAREQADAVEDILLTLQTAESGQRGFLLTGRSDYLSPYQQTTVAIGPLLARLADLARGTAWLQADAAELRTLALRKMEELARTIEISRAEGRDAALAIVQTDTGRVEMEAARAIADRISRQAESERAAGASALRARQRALSLASGAALVLGVLLLGAAGLSLIRNRAALLRARTGERLEAARLQAAVEHFRDGVAVFDAQGRLALQNTRFASTFGVPASSIGPGTTLARLADTVAIEPPLLSHSLADRGPAVAEVRQGSRTLEIWRSAMPDGGQMVAVTDITRRVQAEAIARQAQKMEMIGQMTGGIAHDFNNLLQVISANLELTMDRLARAGIEPAITDRLEAASAGVSRGAQITRHLLAFARRQQLIPEAIDPARLLLSLEDVLRRTLGEAVELKLHVGGGLWAMRADPTQIESALLNLALNARDALAEGGAIPSGRVVIEVANVTLEAEEDVAAGQYIMFALTDSGIGMTQEQLARAMEPFYTTKPEGKGTGLGLPMVFGFAKQSGGHFQLSSEPGRGATARLYIPRTTDPIEPSAPPAPPVAAGEGELVLLVEDDAAVRRVAGAALHLLGFEVQEAGSGEEALALLQSGLSPAALFTDVVMPGPVSSKELAAKAKSLIPGLAVLFTSGYAQDAIARNGQHGNEPALLSKPWRTEELGRALRLAINAARPSRQAAARPTVLLVEDEALVRMTTADVLSELGFDVLEAETGAAALARLDPAPDLLITDLGLPDMDGLALIARVRARLPRLPVVVASGRTDTPDGDVVYLAKPYDQNGLRAALHAALREKALAS